MISFAFLIHVRVFPRPARLCRGHTVTPAPPTAVPAPPGIMHRPLSAQERVPRGQSHARKRECTADPQQGTGAHPHMRASEGWGGPRTTLGCPSSKAHSPGTVPSQRRPLGLDSGAICHRREPPPPPLPMLLICCCRRCRRRCCHCCRRRCCCCCCCAATVLLLLLLLLLQRRRRQCKHRPRARPRRSHSRVSGHA